jgi:hypothetical protein
MWVLVNKEIEHQKIHTHTHTHTHQKKKKKKIKKKKPENKAGFFPQFILFLNHGLFFSIKKPLEILFYFSLFYTISPNLEEKPG